MGMRRRKALICKINFTKCIVNHTIEMEESRGSISMEIKNRVKELRARDGLTQGALAERVHVTRQTIVALEKGSYVPSLLLAMNIARTFELPVEEIFSIEGEDS